MATIGTFKQIGEGEYLGDIFTLSLRANGARGAWSTVRQARITTLIHCLNG